MGNGAFDGKNPLEIFRSVAPAYSSVSDPIVQGYIDQASYEIPCEDTLGTLYNVALAYMAAHIMEAPGGYKKSGAGYSGAMKSFSADGVSYSYATVDVSSSDYLDQTSFGVRYKMLIRKKRGVGALMTRGMGRPF